MALISENTWQEGTDDIIMIRNASTKNYILELPAGRFRLDAGRRMRTLRSIMDVKQVQQLMDRGDLIIEN